MQVEMQTYQWVLGRLHVLAIDILNLDILSGYWVLDGTTVLAGLLCRDMTLDLSMLAVCAQIGFEFGIAFLLVPIKTFDELLDVGDTVCARVWLASGVVPRFGDAVHVFLVLSFQQSHDVWISL